MCHPLRDLGVTYTVHRWLVGKRVVDFLLVLIKPFSLALTVEALWVYERSKSLCLKVGWVTFSASFRGNGASPTNDTWHQKTRVPVPSAGISRRRVSVCLSDFVCLSVCLSLSAHTLFQSCIRQVQLFIYRPFLSALKQYYELALYDLTVVRRWYEYESSATKLLSCVTERLKGVLIRCSVRQEVGCQ